MHAGYRREMAAAHTLGVMVLLLPLAACGGDGGGEPSPPATVLAKLTGDQQTDTVGQVLPDSVKVLVTQSNAPLAGATVSWSTGLAGGSLSPTSVSTDANGLAASQWTLGPNLGVHTITAQVVGSSEVSVNFTATAVHDAPASLSIVTGNNQTGMVNTPLRHLSALVGDQFQNGIPGVPVTWSISDGVVTPEVDITDPGGESTVDVTLGSTPGPITITASSAGLPDLAFNVTAEAVPTEATVGVGNNSFTSDRNSSSNPAADTVAVGATVTWTWRNTGPVSHSVRSLGSPSFTSSVTQSGAGKNHSATFSAAGTYQYDCAVHGSQMTGRVVVR